MEKLPRIEIESEKYLWGVASLLLASKYNEILPNWLKINDLQNLSRKAIFPSRLICMYEEKLLKALEWNLMVKPPLYYLEAFKGEFEIYKDSVFLKYLKIYWEFSIRCADIQKFSSFTIFIWWFKLAAKTSLWDPHHFEEFIRDFSINKEFIQEGIQILEDIDISDYEEYNPSYKMRWSVSKRREKRIYCAASTTRKRTHYRSKSWKRNRKSDRESSFTTDTSILSSFYENKDNWDVFSKYQTLSNYSKTDGCGPSSLYRSLENTKGKVKESSFRSFWNTSKDSFTSYRSHSKHKESG